MSSFDLAFDYMIRNEDYNLTGIVTPEPGGGKARLGINSFANPQALTDGFYDLPLNDAIAYAKTLYQKNYWDSHGFDAVNNQQIATKLFDVAVNMGNGAEHIEVALAVRSAVGPTAVNILTALNTTDPNVFLADLVEVLKEHYHAIYNANPSKYSPNTLIGWLARAIKLPPAV